MGNKQSTATVKPAPVATSVADVPITTAADDLRSHTLIENLFEDGNPITLDDDLPTNYYDASEYLPSASKYEDVYSNQQSNEVDNISFLANDISELNQKK